MAEFNQVGSDLLNNCDSVKGNSPGSYQVEEARIDYGGQDHKITRYLQKIYIFEDIDKFGITGWIELSDTDNLPSGFLEKHTITGQELLYLKFRTLGSKLPVDFSKHPLHIHKIENLRGVDPGTGAKSASALQYRLHFCSTDLLNNDRIRISKSYTDTYSNIIKDILTKILKVRKNIWLEETMDTHRVVIPNMHPFDAINYIKKLAIALEPPTNGQPNFNFYETSKGYRFKTLHVQGPGGEPDSSGLGAFWQMADHQMSWTVPLGKMSGPYWREMRNALDHKFLRIGDTYAAIRQGMLASKSIEHDSFHKTFRVKGTSYLDSTSKDVESLPATEFIKSLHIPRKGGTAYVPAGGTFEAQEPFENSKTFAEFPDSRIFYTSNSTEHRHDYIGTDGKPTTGSIKIDDQLTRPLWQMQQMHDRYTQIQLTVHGLSGLQVGDAIGLDYPAYGPAKKETDKRWSAYYYITKLVHRIDLREGIAKYHCDLVCSARDAARQGLPNNGNLTGSESAGYCADMSGAMER
jgi:hypothetical protein